MKLPYKRDLIQSDSSSSYAGGLHPNPKLYKHDWQLFTLDSALEGEAFRSRGPVLCTAECMARIGAMEAAGARYILYGWKRPRRFPGMPFDPDSPRWRDAVWAPALEDDPDPEWEGHR